ncbi:MAG: hypothetical protein ABSB11_11400 [Sedimentisphaerales bacterium]|jgi:hypothetical protein
MRKLLAMFVLLGVLGVCAPSYGYILVYKVNISYKTLATDYDTIAKGAIKGVLVMNVNDSNESAVIDAADFVLYGNVEGEKHYESLDITDYIELTGSGNNAAITIGATGGIDYSANLFGKLKATNIGLSGTKSIPSALSGGILMNGTFFYTADLIGFSTVSATLDSKTTQTANRTGANVSDVVDNIISALGGYSPLL